MALIRQHLKSDMGCVRHEFAFLYDSRIGVATDHSQAAFRYRKAAEQGDAWAQYKLGAMYSEGRGVPQDFALA
jgi:hypothetical protein